MSEPIYVTKPSLPPLEEYTRLLEGVWRRGVLTHNGPLVQELERRLAERLGVAHLAAVTNGTVALQLAIRALGLRGEVITTPFTWVATMSAIEWEGCRPVFVDVDPATLNLDPAKVEARVTRRTCAIMPVHVFSNPCDVEAIGDVARRRGLRVIYDGAHAFGVRRGGRPLAAEGDVTALSFHATKLFNTGEGGACVTADPELDRRVRALRFFGHDEQKNVTSEGLNGKMTELHAALGLANLAHADEVARKRRSDHDLYVALLGDHPAVGFQSVDRGAYNFSYMPVLFDSEARLLRVEAALQARGVFPRRYFWPTLNRYRDLVPYEPMPVAEDASSRILCLPHYQELAAADIERICAIVRGAL